MPKTNRKLHKSTQATIDTAEMMLDKAGEIKQLRDEMQREHVDNLKKMKVIYKRKVAPIEKDIHRMEQAIKLITGNRDFHLIRKEWRQKRNISNNLEEKEDEAWTKDLPRKYNEKVREEKAEEAVNTEPKPEVLNT